MDVYDLAECRVMLNDRNYPDWTIRPGKNRSASVHDARGRKIISILPHHGRQYGIAPTGAFLRDTPRQALAAALRRYERDQTGSWRAT